MLEDLTGLRFSMLEVLTSEVVFSSKRKRTHWKCRCDCGVIKVISGQGLKNGKVKSCGCLRLITKPGRRHPIYRTWLAMKNRCFNKSDAVHFKHYGARGITVCDRWMEFDNFMSDMLPTWREGLSIDRIDVNGNYGPDNCKWSTPKEQATNRRCVRMIEFNGRTMCMKDWAVAIGIAPQILRSRILNGWPMEMCLTNHKYTCWSSPTARTK